MRTPLRVLAGLNAVFQLVVGALCVAAPAAAEKVFELAQTGASVDALTRMFGGLLFGGGLVNALVARDPDRNPDLPRLLAATSLVNVGADVVVIASGAMTFGQLAAGVVLQIVVAGVALAHAARR